MENNIKFGLIVAIISGAIGLVLLIGCCDSTPVQNKAKVDDWETTKRKECFNKGGFEFEYGVSGGGSHYVCRYRYTKD